MPYLVLSDKFHNIGRLTELRREWSDANEVWQQSSGSKAWNSKIADVTKNLRPDKPESKKMAKKWTDLAPHII